MQEYIQGVRVKAAEGINFKHLKENGIRCAGMYVNGELAGVLLYIHVLSDTELMGDLNMITSTKFQGDLTVYEWNCGQDATVTVMHASANRV